MAKGLEWFGESQSVFRDFGGITKYFEKSFFLDFGEILEKETLKIPERFDAEPRKARLVALATNAPDKNEFYY